MKDGAAGQVGAGALALLLSGTLCSLLAKLTYQLRAPGAGGHVHAFEKPWASTLLMFIAMACCAPGASAARRLRSCLRRQGRAAAQDGSPLQQPLLERSWPGSDASGGTATPPGGSLRPADSAGSLRDGRTLLLIAIPTVFDLAATALMSVGLLSITASVFLMVRGSEVLFTALLSVACLRRRLNGWHLCGLAAITVGIAVVGWASLLDTGREPQQQRAPAAPGPWSALAGMLLVLLAEAVQAAQVVTEDWFMSRLQMRPLTVVGGEGLLGTALMAGLVLPLVQALPGREGGGAHEDSWDTLAMLRHSGPLQAVTAASLVFLAAYNLAGMTCTESLGATTRTVLETTRTLFVWLLSLLLYYADPLPGTRLGEPWTRASWVQAAGFAVLVTGTLVYGRGEEKSLARMRARLRWARLRASLAAVIPLAAAARPLQAPRIAGPARLRTAFLQRAAVAALMERLEESRAEESRASGEASGHHSSAHASVLAAAATAAAAQLEGSDGGGGQGDDEEGGSPSSPTADWVARSRPRVAPPHSSSRFLFAAPPLSHSAPS